MENKLKIWIKHAHPHEQQHVADLAGIKRHYLQRLARGDVPDPGLYTCRRLVNVLNAYTENQANDRLPFLTLDDL